MKDSVASTKKPGIQKLPRFLQVLSNQELKQLTMYVHKSDKTTFEKWCGKHVAGWIELNLIPDIWTPNVITLVGQIPALIMVVVILTQVTPNLDGSVIPSAGHYYAMSFTALWFSQFD